MFSRTAGNIFMMRRSAAPAAFWLVTYWLFGRRGGTTAIYSLQNSLIRFPLGSVDVSYVLGLQGAEQGQWVCNSVSE